MDGVLQKNKKAFKGENIVICSKSESDLFYLHATKERRNPMLSNSERLIAKYLVNGCTYKETAKQLSISPSTVTNHANHIYKKLGIKNKTELACLFANSD